MPKMNVKVFKDNNEMKAISIIKRNTQMSISEIKEKIDKGHYALSCDYFNTEELEELRVIVKLLKEVGVSLELYQDDRAVIPEYLDNLIASHNEISESRKISDDKMLNEQF